MTADSGTILATAYYATHKNLSLRPYHWYKKVVLAGAREHSLPANYVEMVEKVGSFKDSDSARCARERRFLDDDE